jgi:hypothetical protein
MADLEDQIKRYADIAQEAVPPTDLERVRGLKHRPQTLAVVAASVALVAIGITAAVVLRSDPSVTTSTGPDTTGTNNSPEISPSVGDPLPIDDFVCDESGDGTCSDGVVLGDVTYSFTCALPREGDLGQVVGIGGSDPRFVEARAVAGEDPAHVIALIAKIPLELQSMSAELGEPDTCDAPATRVLAYGGTWAQRTADDAQQMGHLMCEVPEVPDDLRCAAGGPFQYFLDPSVDGTEGDEHRSIWLDNAVAATNAALARGGGPRERLDPLDLVALSHDYVQRPSLRPDEDLYRVGVRILEQAPGRMVIEVLHQSGQVQGSKVTYETQREEFTYEQLGGGPGWWETRFIVREYSNDNPRSGSDGRAAMDADWADCCDRVLVELEP